MPSYPQWTKVTRVPGSTNGSAVECEEDAWLSVGLGGSTYSRSEVVWEELQVVSIREVCVDCGFSQVEEVCEELLRRSRIGKCVCVLRDFTKRSVWELVEQVMEVWMEVVESGITSSLVRESSSKLAAMRKSISSSVDGSVWSGSKHVRHGGGVESAGGRDPAGHQRGMLCRGGGRAGAWAPAGHHLVKRWVSPHCTWHALFLAWALRVKDPWHRPMCLGPASSFFGFLLISAPTDSHSCPVSNCESMGFSLAPL